MRTRDVRIRFDPTARRWWLGGEDAPADELVIDAIRPDAAALAPVVDAFGPAVAERMRHLADGDLDEVLDLTIAAPVPTEISRVEPGVLSPVGPARWTVVTEVGPAEVEMTPGLVHVVIAGMASAGLWVRVSTARSGALVACGALTAHGGGLEARLAMGLDLEATEVVITVSDDPLTDIGDRWTRTARRFDELMGSATALARRHPRRAAALAHRAVALADVLGDVTRSTMAMDLAAAWQRRWLLRWLGGSGFVIAAVMVVLAVGGGSDSPSTPTADPAEVPTTPEWTAADGDPGPSTFAFADGSGVMIAVDGAEPVARPGGTWNVGLRVTSREVGVFDIDGDVTRAAERCRLGTPVEITAGALNPGMFSVRLTRTDGNGGTSGSIVAGQVPFNPQTDPIAAVPDTCGDLSTIDGRVLAEHSVVRAGQSAGFTLPADMAPGLWDVTIDMGGQPIESMFGRVRLVVLADG
ncbi:MAG: hypothetical protein ACO35E_10655 [Ilumatobacteraceae bacterium]